MDLVQGEILDCFSATDMPAWLMAHILIEIFNGLRWLHGAGLCHGDLHEANVMLAKSESVPRVFIIDLGSCRDLDKKAERDDCHSVFAIIRNIVERSPMWDQALGRIRENAPDEEKNKQRLLDVLDQKAGDDRKGAEQCTVQAVWEACGDLAESIRSGGDQALPTDITEALGGDFTGGRMLEELAAKGGIDVELFSE